MKITAKQVVIVKKTAAKSRKAAARVARPHADRRAAAQETGSSFRFIQRPTSCFIPGTYRTAKLSKSISIVYGVLKRGAKNRAACKKK